MGIRLTPSIVVQVFAMSSYFTSLCLETSSFIMPEVGESIFLHRDHKLCGVKIPNELVILTR